MRRSAYNNLLVKEALTIAARTATANGASVDRTPIGARTALVVIHTGTITDGTHTISIQESDDNSSWGNVPAGDLQGSAPAIVAADDNRVFEVGYMGHKRYVRVISTVTAATTGGIYGALIVLAYPSTPPVSH